MLDLGKTNSIKEEQIEDTTTVDEIYASFLEADQTIVNYYNALKIAAKALKTHSNECIEFANDLLGVSCEVVLNDSGKIMKQLPKQISIVQTNLHRMYMKYANLQDLCKKEKYNLNFKYKIPQFVYTLYKNTNSRKFSKETIDQLMKLDFDNTVNMDMKDVLQAIQMALSKMGSFLTDPYMISRYNSSIFTDYAKRQGNPDALKDQHAELRANFKQDGAAKASYIAIRKVMAELLQYCRNEYKPIRTAIHKANIDTLKRTKNRLFDKF